MKSQASGSAGRERWVANVLSRFVTVLFLCFLLLQALPGAAQETSNVLEIPDEAVSRKVLDNGLTILAAPSEATDLVSVNLLVKSGAANEGEYLGSGIAHFIEHMVFKGTGTRSPGDIEREIKSYGGSMNGCVMQDFTSFTILVPSGHLTGALSILKDMMQNASFDQKEFEREREVILNEANLGNDDPNRVLIRRLNETAYMDHPYRFPPIGYPEMFKALTRDDLVRHYKTVYVPNNMIISIAGGIEPARAIEFAANEFKDFRLPNYTARDLARAEPPQIAGRSRQEEVQANLSYLAMGFHSTRLASEDLYAMDVLSMILGRGDNSRLNRALVKDMRVAHTVSAWNYTPRDPGLFVVTAITDRETLAEAKAAVLAEIDTIKTALVNDIELLTAKRMALSDLIFSRQTIDGLAMDIAKSEAMTGSCDFSEDYVRKIQSVTREDVKSAAAKYLTEDNLTSIELVPFGTKDAAAAPAASSGKSETMMRELMHSGLRIVVRPDTRSPVISITAAFTGGLSAEKPARNGISNLTAQMLLKGTKARDEEDIRGAADRLGGNISAFSGYNSLGVNIVVLKHDLNFALDLVFDILNNPTFPEDELDKEKSLVMANIRDEDNDIFQNAANGLRRILFAGSPYAMRTTGTLETVSAITRDDIADFHNSYCSADNMVISISGDVKPEAVIKRVNEKFRNLRAGPVPILLEKEDRADERAARTIEMQKDQSVILVGFETVDNKDPDRFTLEVISSILSGSSGRLYHSLRADKSLAYVLGCVNRQMTNTGYFVAYVATTREKIDEARGAMLDQIKSIRTKRVTPEELELAKRELTTALKNDMQLNQFVSYTSAIDELIGPGYNDVYKYRDGIRKVTRNDVLATAKKYLDTGRSAEITVLSPPPEGRLR